MAEGASVGEIFQGNRESVAFKSLAETAGPVKSILQKSLYKLSGGRIRPELGQFFKQESAGKEPVVGVEEIPSVLQGMEIKVRGVLGVPEEQLGQDVRQWEAAKKSLQPLLGENAVVEDVFYSDEHNSRFILFYRKNEELYPLSLSLEGTPKKYIEVQVQTPLAAVKIPESASPGSPAAESAILKIIDAVCPDASPGNLYLAKSSANNYELRSNSKFDRDGEMISYLRKRGGMSLGEIQELERVALDYFTKVDETGHVKMDKQLASLWVSASNISRGEVPSDERGREQSLLEIGKLSQEKTYYGLVTQYFLENPDAVLEFMNSKAFTSNEKTFRNFFLAANGQTNFRKAAGLLANYYLFKYEGVKTPEESNSLKNWEDGRVVLEQIEKYLRNNSGSGLPDIPEPHSEDSIAALLHSVKGGIYKTENTSQAAKFLESYKKEVINKAEISLGNLNEEIRRHKIGRRILETIKKHLPFALIEDEDQKEEMRQKPFRVLITNLALAHVPGEDRMAMASWFRETGYYPEGSKLLPFEESDAVTGNVYDALRYIFNGEIMGIDETNSAYESQVSRIYTEGTVILKFLSEDQRVPQNVREMIKTLTSERLADIVLGHFGPRKDQDPNKPNRFHQSGFDQFQLETEDRYLTDFIRGVETRLILKTAKNPLEKLARRTIGGWRNNNFSGVSEKILNQAVEETLKSGSERIKKLNHEVKTAKTLKDIQETLEKNFGWDTYDMWFLRWDKFMDFWNTLGGAWDCMCFARKPIFNTGTFQQY